MSPIESMLHAAVAAFRAQQKSLIEAWAAEAHAANAALAEHHRRSIGQQVRQARIRLAAAQFEKY